MQGGGGSMMGSIMRPNSPHTVAQFVNANSIMGKMTLCQFLHAHINVFVPLLVCVCVCVWEGSSKTVANSPNLFICKLDFG